MSFEITSESQPASAERDEQMRAMALQRAPSEVAEAAAAKNTDELFYALSTAASAAFRLGQFEHARSLATKALELAHSYRTDWNYGNAIHFAHTVLGLLALQGEDVTEAIVQLHLAGNTPGSPQLNSFGPTMELAMPLLKRDKFDEVLTYLDQCRKFWISGSEWLNQWEIKLKDRRIPNFVMHAYR